MLLLCQCEQSGFLVTSMIKACLPQSLRLARRLILSPGGSKFLPFTVDGGHCAHWYNPDTILSWRSTDSSLDFMAWFVLWHALLAKRPYKDSCVFLNCFQST